MSKKGVDISFIKPAMDNDDWKREVTDVEKCLVIVEVFLLFLDKTEKEKIEGPNLPELRKQISALAPPAVE